MSILTFFLIIVHLGQTTQGETNDLQTTVAQAVLDSYDTDQPFDVNFFSILHLMCPRSVQCDAENTPKLNFSYLEDRIDDTLALSHWLPQNKNQSMIQEARMYLQSAFRDMHSCCQSCDCTYNCRERNRCCPLKKPEDKIDTPTITQRCVYPTIYDNDNGRETYDKYFLMTTDCLNTSVGEDVITKCKYPNIQNSDEMIPVYSEYSDSIFRNKFCAICNNEFKLISWQIIVSFIDSFALYGKSRLQDSFEKLYQSTFTTHKQVKLSIELPNEIAERKSQFQCVQPPQFGLFECPRNIHFDKKQYNFFKHACSYYQSRYRKRYRNVFCYICSVSRLNSNMVGCETDSFMFQTGKFTAVMLPRDNTHTGHVEAMVSKDSPCTCEEYFDKQNATCREVFCPPGTSYYNCSCEPFLANVTGMMVKMFLEVRPMTMSSHIMEVVNATSPDVLVKRVQSSVNKFFRNRWGPMEIHHMFMYRETSLSDSSHLKFHILLIIRSNLAIENIHLMKTIYDLLYSGEKVTIFRKPMLISLGKIVNTFVYNTHVEANYSSSATNDLAVLSLYNMKSGGLISAYRVPYFQTLKKLLFCKRVSLSTEEMSMFTNISLTSGQKHNALDYIYEESYKEICLDDFINIFHKSNTAAFQKGQSRSQALVLSIIALVSILQLIMC